MVLVRNAMVVEIIILIALSVENNHLKAESQPTMMLLCIPAVPE